jgi:hypothetical protein
VVPLLLFSFFLFASDFVATNMSRFYFISQDDEAQITKCTNPEMEKAAMLYLDQKQTIFSFYKSSQACVVTMGVSSFFRISFNQLQKRD